MASIQNSKFKIQNWPWLGGLLVVCAVALVPGACGEDDNAPRIAEVDSRPVGEDQDGRRVVGPAEVKLPDAPTKTHGALGRLIPRRTELDEGSIAYGGWNPESAGFFAAEPASADFPAVTVEYVSTSYPLLDGDGNEVKRVAASQRAKVYIVEAPESLAAQELALKAERKLLGKGFVQQSDRKAVRGRGEDDVESIRTFKFAEESAGASSTYLAYLVVSGKRFIYAIETEARTKRTVSTAKGEVELPVEGGGESKSTPSLGAQLLVQILYRM